MNDVALLKKIAKLSYEKKATNILAYDLDKISDLARYSFICSAGSDRQAKAICETIKTTIKQQDGRLPYAIEGADTGHWILMDYGTIIINIFLEFIRNYYALEQLWGKASTVDLELPENQ